MESGPPTVVLVHGAWHGPWVWHEVRQHLDTAGIPSAVVNLPSVGDRTGGLADDVEAIHAVLDELTGPVVLVGHSYGGLPVTQAALRDDVVLVGYVCAFTVPVGTSLLDSWPGWRSLVLPSDPRATLYGECAPAVADRAIWRLRPHSTRSVRDPLGAAAYGRTPATYVVCARDAFFPVRAQQRCAAVAGAEVVSLDTDHSPMLSRPAELAAILAVRSAVVTS